MRRSSLLCVTLVAVATLVAGCASQQAEPPQPAAPPVVPTLPPSFSPLDLVGKWGLAAYHKPEDRDRTEAAARNQCRNPYVITPGPTGGIMMHLADQAQPSELTVKGAPGGRNYIGPKDEPPGSSDDREVEQFDGRILILRWMDQEVQGRYGTMVYVRCGAEGGKKPPARRKPAAKPKPPAPPKQ